jgi:hypothetical protein
MSEELLEDPVPPSVLELLTIYKTDLAKVSFPDVSLETLESLTQKVRKGAKDLQEALKAADAAREALESGQNELITKAARGLAYAKVFAEGNDDLIEKLSKISLGKTLRTPKKTSQEKSKSEKPESEATLLEDPKSDEKKSGKASKKASEQPVS